MTHERLEAALMSMTPDLKEADIYEAKERARHLVSGFKVDDPKSSKTKPHDWEGGEDDNSSEELESFEESENDNLSKEGD